MTNNIDKLVIKKNYHLGEESGFTYIGKDENGHNFACFVEGKPLSDIYVFPIKEDLLIIEGDKITSKENKFPFYRLESERGFGTIPSREYYRVAGLIRRSSE